MSKTIITDELKWMKTKLLKMEAIEGINWELKLAYEKMGMLETLQIKSIEMYGHKDFRGRDKVYIDLYTQCGDYNQLFK
ncbi:hypothetical protein LCGC14_2426930 [marine sediment metagenome]|uniref:Uncharacterized protein n=1 Tax=marine sediment metagenome TaxID=412755 RepID=A0A0F9BN27_9ZZZZ